MDVLRQSPLTLNLANAGVALGTTSTYSTTASTSGCINGKFCTVLTAQTNAATPTTDAGTGSAFAPIPVGYGACIVFGINAAGAIKIAQGPTQKLDGSGAFFNAPLFPAIPDNFLPLAYATIRVGSTASGSFTVGTTSWTATGMTVSTPQNIVTLPGLAQIS